MDRASKPRRRAGLQPRPAQIQAPDLIGQNHRRRFAIAAALELALSDVGQTVEKRPGRDDHGAAMDVPAVHQLNAANPAIFNPQRRHLGLFDPQVRLALQNLLHANPVLLLIALGAGRPDRRAAAGIEQPELNSNRIRHFAHDAAERVDLADEMTLGNTADRGIAGHLRDQVGVHRDHHGAQSHAGAGTRGLAAGVAPTDHDNVERLIHLRYYCSRANHLESTCYWRRRPGTRVGVETAEIAVGQ